MYVYAVSVGEYLKFGVAKNPPRRLRYIAIHCPLEAKLVAACGPMPRSDAFMLEAYVHRACVDYHARGEWFRKSPVTLSASQLLAAHGYAACLEHFSGRAAGRWLMQFKDERLSMRAVRP